MSFFAKRHLVIGLLVAISLWPLAHHAIVRSTGLSPWKGFGWSMYCVPPRNVRAYVYAAGTDQPLPLEILDPSSQSAVKAAYKRFSDMRAELGPSVTPDIFAVELLRRYRDVAAVDIYVEHRILGRSSARIERESFDRYRYERGKSAGATLIQVTPIGLDGRPLERPPVS